MKYHVECRWCFWNGHRLKSRIAARCPKCRKSHTVELYDENKIYSEEERVRHRKLRMIDAGAKEIRPGVWICESPRMCSDRDLKRLKEFKDYYTLYMLLMKDCISTWIAQARRKRMTVAKILGTYIQIRKIYSPKIASLIETKNKSVEELEIEMEAVWPLDSCVVFRQYGKKDSVNGTVQAHDGLRECLYITTDNAKPGKFCKFKKVRLDDIV